MRAKLPFWKRLPDARETAWVGGIALAICIATGVVFSLWPGLDLAVSRQFQLSSGEFALSVSPFWSGAREVFLQGYTVWYVTIVAAGLIARQIGGKLFRLDWKQWAFIGLCSVAGPLLLVNVGLKGHWGRWRPRQIVEFGGNEAFTPPLDFSGTCMDNCSFVSGEVSSMTMAFIALAFMSGVWRPVFYAMAIFGAATVALIRVGQGGHFLSDSLLAAGLMGLLAAGLYWAAYLRRG